ncbi:MAG: sigma-70 family RNA polymerase sigma factor [Bacteroidota bacterium]|nr:sigma-70 family RNA polymerase sigma factor [Bacteroidota bacterium]
MPFETIYNEKDLLSRVAQDDRNAFGQLYSHYYALVQKYISLFEPSRESLGELTQDVFVRIWEKRALLQNVDSFRNYVFLVTRNLVLNYIKALKIRRKLSELGSAGEAEVGEDTETIVQFRQYYQLFLEAVVEMPAGMRNVLKMNVEQGLSLDEIAGKMAISKAGVKKQLLKAKAFVRQYLRDHGELSLLLFVFLSLFEP